MAARLFRKRSADLFFQPQQVIAGEGIEVGRSFHQTETVQLVDRGVPGEYVHCFSSGKVQYAPLYLRRASAAVRTEPAGFVFLPYQRGAAFRTALGELGPESAFGPLSGLYRRDLGDDFATLFDINIVAHMDVQKGHLIGVVECGAPYCRA